MIRIIRKDDEKNSNYIELIKSVGGQVVSFEVGKQKQLEYNGILFEVGNLVRSIPCWYAGDIIQGRIIGFSYFEYHGEWIPSVELELLDGSFDKTHPSNLEIIDESWFEMC